MPVLAGLLVFLVEGRAFAMRPGDPTSGAADNAAADSFQLKPLAVYGISPLQRNEQVLDSADFQPFLLGSITDALAWNSGLTLKPYGPGQLVSAGYRGGPARHTAVRWNGLRINSPMNGTVDLSRIPLYGMQSVRLSGGTEASALSGSALGGVLDLETGSSDINSGWQGELAPGWGSFGVWEGAASLQFTGHRVSTQSSGGFQMAAYDYPVHHPLLPEYRMLPADLRRWHVLQELSGYSGKTGQYGFSVFGTGMERAIPPGLQSVNQREFQEDALWLGTAHYSMTLHSWDLAFRAGWMEEDFLYTNQQAEIDSRGRSGIREIGGSVARDLIRTLHWQGQSSIRLEQVRSANYTASLSRFEWRMQQALEWRFRPGWNLRADMLAEHYGDIWMPLQPVLRLQGESAYATPASGAGGSTWYWSTGWGVARHFARPSLNDWFWEPGGNPDLQPEIGWMGDADARLGFKSNTVHLELHAMSWYGQVHNWIQWAPGSSGYWEAKNLKEVRSRGTEWRIQGSAHFNEWRFGIESGYTFTDARTLDKAYLLYQPRHQQQARIHLQYKTALLALRQQAQSWKPATSDGFIRLPSFSLFSADVGYSFRASGYRVQLFASSENLANRYIEGILRRPQPPRSFRVRLLIHFQQHPNSPTRS